MDAGSDQEVREFLANHKIPQFIDTFLKKLIELKPTDWQPVLRDMVCRMENADGKGSKAHLAAQEMALQGSVQMKNLKYGGSDPFWNMGLGEYNIPEHCKRDPRVRPSVRSVQSKGVVEHERTMSAMRAPELRKDYATTVAAQFNYAAMRCIEECKKIQAKCNRENKPFFDEKFWYGYRSAMYPKGCPSDCTVTEPTKAKRASELYPGAPLIATGTHALDIVQGAVGDCFFIGAVSALACSTASNLDPIGRLFVFQDIKWGIYGVVFAKQGGWEWVIVDDWVSVCVDNRGNTWPQYASPATEPELWPMIVEKAYAKIHFCWDTIDGGWTRYALEDLTGGLAYTLDLYKKDRREYGTTYQNFRAVCDDPYTVLGCAVGRHVSDAGGRGRAGESGSVHGLFKGHAYSVLKFQVTSDGQGFVRVRNPWGDSAEWTGAYGDKSREWNRNPLHKKELNPEVKADGAFWMKWDDFRTIFTDVDVTKFFHYDSACLAMHGRGPRYDLTPENTYILKVDKAAKGVVLSLGQDCPKSSRDHHTRKNAYYKMIQLSIYSLSREPSSMSDVRNCLQQKIQTPYEKVRTQNIPIDLEPGVYSLMPKFPQDAGVGYYLRVFAPADSHLSIYRFKDGPGKALSVARGKEAAAEIPPVAVPDHDPPSSTETYTNVVELPEAVTPKVEDTNGADTNGAETNGGKTDDAKDAEFEKMLGHIDKCFDEQDRYGRGKINERQALDAVKDVILGNSMMKKAIDEEWDKYNKHDSKYFKIKLGDFKKLTEAVLEEVIKP